MKQYVVYLHQDAGTDIGLSFPDFPGCIATCENLLDVGRVGKEVLEFHIDGMRRSGLEIPEPSGLEMEDVARESVLAVAFVKI
ncbi:MAG: hypothetical protein BGO51_22040 [Rhodospirillales bacterium 69-11]|nr:type II toxin-antitoxin system HicB family antitoxin [Rhodospirillales bacterium]MBN8929957.1 type II toxin-antitoxin system HicB family antitoxin [Rhodospirillales bacterium]OJW20525.1 MAG: hypothetical protein BGO51_22040 [Rhodospirillales bacterium 69-11]